jgi:sulfate adenylyltransferase subunit 1
MPVQYVVRPRSNEFHDFRAYAGRLSSGKLKVGDEVTALPSGRKSKITKLFQYQQELNEVTANQSFTLMLEDNIDISRGDMLVRTEEAPTLKNEFSAQCCWLNNANLSLGKTYLIQHGTQLTKAKVTKVDYVQDPITQHKNIAVETLKMNDLASISLKTAKPLPIDFYAENQANGAFILIDETSNQTLAVGFASA